MAKYNKTRLDYLGKANTVSSVLALFAVVAAVPGALRLYRFSLDAADQKIERVNLLGFGDLIPMVREPYVTLIILVLSILIPFLVLVFLLFKKRRLGRERLTGRGLYWFIALAGVFGIFYGLGIVPKLLRGNFSEITNLNTDPESSVILITSAVSIIAAFMAIRYLGKAMDAPQAPAEEDEDLVLERRDGRYAQISQPLSGERAEVDEEYYENATIVMDSPLGAMGLQPSVSPAEAASAVVMADPREETGHFNAPHQPVSAEDFDYSKHVSSQEEPAFDPDPLKAPIVPVDGTDGPAAPYIAPAQDPAGDPVSAAPSASADESAVLPPSEILYRFVPYPWDDAKVIRVLREYRGEEFVREWAEVRFKSEFEPEESPTE